MRTRKTVLNVISDVLPQIVIIAIAIFKSKIFLNNLGDDNVGLYNYLNQIIAYLSLAELGLTSAVMYYLYNPIRGKNYLKIAQLVNGAKFTFKIIMIVIFVIGVIVAPFLPHLIKNLQFENIYVIEIFLIILVTNVLTYFSTPFIITFDAYQEKYKYIFWFQLLIILRNIISIILVLVFKNLFLVVALECITSILQNVIIRFLYKKNFKMILATKTTRKDLSFLKKVKSLVPHRLGYIISQNIDIVIVTMSLGLSSVAIYTCYNYIVNCFNVLIGRVSSATLASIGDLIEEKKEKSFNLFLEYNSLLNFFALLIVCPLFIVFNNFISIWYGEKYLLSTLCVLIFCLILYYNIIRINLTTFSSGDGLFKETLVCVWTEVIINLVLSIVLVRYIGILGLVLGTLISMVIGEFIICPHILNKHIFKNKISKYYIDCLLFAVLLTFNIAILSLSYSLFNIQNIFVWFMTSILIFILNFIFVVLEFKIAKKNSIFDRFKNLKKERVKTNES